MAHESKSDLLAQYGPIGAPVLGVLLAIILIGVAVGTSGVSDAENKLKTSIKQVDDKRSSKAVSASGGSSIPLPDSVKTSFAGRAGSAPTVGDGSRKMQELPIAWQVVMAVPPENEFAKADENGDGFIDKREFDRWAQPTDDPLRREFKNWDRNDDGLISPAEFADPPTSDEDRFRELNKNGDKFLTGPDEITDKEAYDWDRYPFDGKITLEEYKDRYKPRTERDYGPVQNVIARFDPVRMVVVITWDNPDVAKVPEDIVFMIQRRAPETVEKRKREHRQQLIRFQDRDREYMTGYREWAETWLAQDYQDGEGNRVMVPIPDAPEDAETRERPKTNGEQFQTETQRVREYERITGKQRPSQPQEPSEWENVPGADRVSGNEHLDPTFDLDVTYTYAVRMRSAMPPDRGQPGVPLPNSEGWYAMPESTRVVQSGQPVFVRNQLGIAQVTRGMNNATFALTQWLKVVDTNDVHSWYRVQITETAEAEAGIGGNYRTAQLKERGLKLLDVSGTEVADPWSILPSNLALDYSTQFRFIMARGAIFLLTSREYGDHELPDATKPDSQAPVVVSTPGDGENIEVRALAIKSSAGEGYFEVMRWHRAGDQWVRVLWAGRVKQGSEVGASVKLNAAGLTVWDSSGNVLTGAALAALGDHTVNLTAGAYEGINGRTLTIGGQEFDLLGTLYKN